MKPMNCPGHCLVFRHRQRSYRELPIRMADFGVLHRNELKGALTGLTRVRRFQQDDAHIFCRVDQIMDEVLGALDFMQSVYGVMGMRFKLERSTRPKKAIGVDTEDCRKRWDVAEDALAKALDKFAGLETGGIIQVTAHFTGLRLTSRSTIVWIVCTSAPRSSWTLFYPFDLICNTVATKHRMMVPPRKMTPLMTRKTRFTRKCQIPAQSQIRAWSAQ